MNEEDIALVRQIVKETLYEILETEFYDSFFNMLDACEAGITSFRQQLGAKKGVAKEEKPKPTWDPSRIKWAQAQGISGPYERYPAEGEKPEASEDYKRMLADLKAHNGRLSRKEADGSTWFYWVFQDAATVGRKKRGGKSESAAQTQPQEPQLDKIKAAFPEDLQPLLTFEAQGEMCVIKARQFLGSENFAKIASVVRGLGGTYISAGKESHFEVPIHR